MLMRSSRLISLINNLLYYFSTKSLMLKLKSDLHLHVFRCQSEKNVKKPDCSAFCSSLKGLYFVTYSTETASFFSATETDETREETKQH